ncbi:30S ribosomal protein S6 [Candidatus Saccharibacteria bacterium]|nr:30S ribosomal protein S6 [Candidatus Saccharibacteria bacterium]
MSARATQTGAIQGAGEERNEDVQNGTSSKHRSPQADSAEVASATKAGRTNASESASRIGGSASEQYSAVRGSVNQYEIAVLYHPDLEIDLGKASAKVEQIIATSGGKITKTDNWGKRKLAYPIKKNDFAVYVFYDVAMEPSGVAKIEQTFNITDEIIRFLITRPDFKAKAKAEALAKEKAKKAAERSEKDDEDKDDERETEKPRRSRIIAKNLGLGTKD